MKILNNWPGSTLLEAAQVFDEQKELAAKSDTLAEVLNAYYEAKETSRSPRYVNQLDQVRNRIITRAGDVPVGTLDSGAINEILEEKSPWTRNMNGCQSDALHSQYS